MKRILIDCRKILDGGIGTVIKNMLREFSDSGGAVLVASHDASVEAHADRCYTLKNGALVEAVRRS